MKRFLYRSLLWLHPSSFRERYACEMLQIFDEVAATGSAQLFGDSVISLLRQWFIRSGAWKRVLGVAMSSLLFAALASGLEFSQRASSERYNQTHKNLPQSVSPFDRADFDRRAVRAVAMLAHFRDGGEKRRRAIQLPSRNPAIGPSPGSPSHPD